MHIPFATPGCRVTRFVERHEDHLVIPMRLDAADAGGARLLAHLHMPASRATVLRLVNRLPLPDAPAPVRVGIDDWAIRKGSRYGTIVVDLDLHGVIDLLPDRTASTGAGWLERHSSVAIVARDRSTEYARGASIGAPQAQQVADRWHLLANMRQTVECWLHGAHARLRSLPLPLGSTVRPVRCDRAFARSTAELEAGAQSRMRWQAIYDEVRQWHAGGEPLLGIARAMGLARATVRWSCTSARVCRSSAFSTTTARNSAVRWPVSLIPPPGPLTRGRGSYLSQRATAIRNVQNYEARPLRENRSGQERFLSLAGPGDRRVRRRGSALTLT